MQNPVYLRITYFHLLKKVFELKENDTKHLFVLSLLQTVYSCMFVLLI